VHGTYRNIGNPVKFYLNSETGLNVVTTPLNEYVTGAKLAPDQVNDILTKKVLW